MYNLEGLRYVDEGSLRNYAAEDYLESEDNLGSSEGWITNVYLQISGRL